MYAVGSIRLEPKRLSGEVLSVEYFAYLEVAAKRSYLPRICLFLEFSSKLLQFAQPCAPGLCFGPGLVGL